ncbi:FxsA family protein [Aeromonas crassostreae]
MGKLFLLFIGLSLLELTVMIQVGTVIGALPTVVLIVLTAMVGSALVRRQGLKTLLEAQQRMQLGEMPARELLGGMLLALAGLLLIVPGFVTDLLGLLLLLPPLRGRLADKLVKGVRVQGAMGGFPSQEGFGTSPEPRLHDRPGTTIEGEFERKE